MSLPNDVAIRVKGVKKDFILPHEKNSSIKSSIVNVFRKKDNGAETQHALKEITFDVKKGDFFGVVGRNGSGKSTLLKILAQIYQPTAGTVETTGKVVPFIELGVGFNPELTGKENVYLNGAMLGFSKRQIDAMYDNIVEFAELENFMDQKLKNYSSGMQVRLAFSVATRAEADVLIVDEVLAVGDAAFQRKCYEYFKGLKETNTTIVFVTHDMSAVENFCNKAIMIQDGYIIADGTPQEVANEYTRANFAAKEEPTEDDGYEAGLSKRVPSFDIKIRSKKTIRAGENVEFDVVYEVTEDVATKVKFSIRDTIRGFDVLQNVSEPVRGLGKHTLTYKMPTEGFNDMELLITAVLDVDKTNERIAHTNDKRSGRVIVDAAVIGSGGGLLNKDHSLSGGWGK